MAEKMDNLQATEPGPGFGSSASRAMPSTEPQDPWKHRTQMMKCETCLWYLAKKNGVGRCRRHSPTMSGYPVVFGAKDWCGDHKLSETKVAG